MKVTTKVVTYDAVKIPAAGADFDASVSDLEWVLDAALTGSLRRTDTGMSITHADQGAQTGEAGDYLMRAADGAIAICPAGAFDEHYEVAPAAAPVVKETAAA